MAISLSTKTATTGPLSREAFDPNIGFKSGLESVAQGLSKVASSAEGMADTIAANKEKLAADKEKIADKIAADQEKVYKSTANNNSIVHSSNVDADFRTLYKVMQDDNATQEQVAEAQANFDSHATITAETLDPNGVAPTEYYDDSIVRLQADYKSKQQELQNIRFSQTQKKEVELEASKLSRTNSAANDDFSTESATLEAQSIFETFDEDHLFSTINDRSALNKQVINNYETTFDVTLLRLNQQPLNPMEKAKELAKLEASVRQFASVDDPYIRNKADLFLTKIQTNRDKLIAESGAARKEAMEAYSEIVANDSKALHIRMENQVATSSTATYETSTLLADNGVALVLSESNKLDPNFATDTQIKEQNLTVNSVYANAPNAEGYTPRAAAAIALLNGEAFKGYSPEVYDPRRILGPVPDEDLEGVASYAELINNPDVLKAETAAVTKLANEIRTAVDSNDFSALSKISPAIAQAMKAVDKIPIINKDDYDSPEAYLQAVQNAQGSRDLDFVKADIAYQTARANKTFGDLLEGKPDFGIIPVRGSEFSNMTPEGQLRTLQTMVQKNGIAAISVAQNLQASGNEADQIMGVLMEMEISGNGGMFVMLNKTGSEISPDKSYATKDEEKKISGSYLIEVKKRIQDKAITTPLDILATSASRNGNMALAEFYRNIENGMLIQYGNSLTAGTVIDPKDAVEALLERQEEIVYTLGTPDENENGITVRYPPPVGSDAKWTKAQSYFNNPNTFTRLYAESALKVLFNNNKEIVGRIGEKYNVAEMNPALREALSVIKINVDEGAALVRGALNNKSGQLPYVDLGALKTIGGATYVVPKFYDQQSGKYDILINKETGKPYTVSLDEIYTDINPEQYKKPDTITGVLTEFSAEYLGSMLGL